MASVTNVQIRQSYVIYNIDDVIALYSRIRWHRAPAEAGPYEPATAASIAAATLLSSRATVFDVQGLDFTFEVGGIEVTVSFTGIAALSAADVVSQINAATALVVASPSSGKVLLTTAETGSDASIRVTGGDACPYLGFVVGDTALGKDPDTVLVSGTHEYFFTDYNSDPSYFYKAELLNHLTSSSAGLSIPFASNLATRVPLTETIACFVKISDMRGAPIPNRTITVANVGALNRAQTATWGVFRQYDSLTTDANGYAEIRLLRGILVDVTIDGTGFVRRIQIPTTGDIVDLLDEDLVTQDEFGIQKQNIDFAIRMS